MKILPNIPGLVYSLRALTTLTPYRKNIRKYRAEGNLEKERKYILKATSEWGKRMMELFGAKLKVYGKENLPEKGPVVYVSNHQGYVDIVALCAALDTIQFAFVAKEELAKVPLYGSWITEIRSVLIRRNNPKESLKAISLGVKYIKEGFSMLIFPEGTRSRSSQMGNFKKGALKLATKPKAPIVPISIEGSYHCFEEKGYLIGDTIKIKIHPMIDTSNLSKDDEKHISAKVEEIIREGVNSLR